MNEPQTNLSQSCRQYKWVLEAVKVLSEQLKAFTMINMNGSVQRTNLTFASTSKYIFIQNGKSIMHLVAE